MIHMLTAQNHAGVTIKCGKRGVERPDATVWFSEVDCLKCRGRVEPTPPPTKVMRRRSKGA